MSRLIGGLDIFSVGFKMNAKQYEQAYASLDFQRLYYEELAKTANYAGELMIARKQIEAHLQEAASMKAMLAERQTEIIRLNRENAVLIALKDVASRNTDSTNEDRLRSVEEHLNDLKDVINDRLKADEERLNGFNTAMDERLKVSEERINSIDDAVERKTKSNGGTP